jgi:phospholipid-binding lipoprotein MlaA
MNNTIAFLARGLRAALSVALLAALVGCAGIPGPNPRDPFERFNREMMVFNEHLDAVVLKPTATAYRTGVPPSVRTGVSNFFGNLQDFWSAVNSLLQFRLQNAGESWARFQINTMVGFFGIYDAASLLNIEKHKEDFGQTLGRWGVPPGPYIVLPLLGSSTLRDAAALPVEWQGDLVFRVPRGDERTLLGGLRVVDRRSNLLRAGDVLDQASLDKYSFTRDAYLQRRSAEVFDYREGKSKDGKDNDGAEPREDAPAPARSPASTPAR